MANPEIKTYIPEDEDLNELKGEVASGAKKTEISEPKDAKTTEVTPMSEEEATQEVKKIIESNETLNTLNGLQVLNEKYEANALPENVKILYEQARNKAIKKLKEDPDFKVAMREAWTSLDKIPLLEIWKKEAKNKTEKILGAPETKKQLQTAEEVINGYSLLSPEQKKILDIYVKMFQDSISETFQSLIEKKAD